MDRLCSAVFRMILRSWHDDISVMAVSSMVVGWGLGGERFRGEDVEFGCGVSLIPALTSYFTCLGEEGESPHKEDEIQYISIILVC